MTYPHGLFCWTDVSLADPQSGVEFYTGLFGWDAENREDDEGSHVYTRFARDGASVAGLGPRQEGADGPPPMWTSYVAVDDLDETLALWTSHGGAVLLPAMDVMGAGRMAVVADPESAVLALWEAREHRGAEVFAEHGALAWNELSTRDSAMAREFYGSVLGWGFEAHEGDGPGEYWLITLDAKTDGGPYRDDRLNGGILTMDSSWPSDLPAHWMVYFRVDDTDEAVERLTDLGGQVSVSAFDTGAGRVAVVSDPQGGTFSLISDGTDGS